MRLRDCVLVAVGAVWLGWGCASGKGEGGTGGQVDPGDAAGAVGGAGGAVDAPVAEDRTMEGTRDGAPPDRGSDAASDTSVQPEPDASAGPALARTWTVRSSPVTVGFESLAAGDSAIVAAGHDAVIVSNDGVSWRKPTSPVVASEVAFGAGTFVAVSQNGDVSWSTDGDSWTAATVPAKAKDPGVAYGAGTFALIAHGYGDAWYASPDGKTWSRRSVEPAEVRSRWNLIFTTFGSRDRLFASKSTPLAGGNFVTTDGVTWGEVPEWHGITYDLAWNGAIYCASGSVGFTHRSADGKSWSSSMTVAESLLTVTSLDGNFYLAGSFGTVLASRDCQTWEEGASPRMPMQFPSGEQLAFEGIRAFKGRLVLVGTGGAIFTSP
jgi:hypothetical protein